MKAVVYRQTGTSSVLHLIDRPIPEPGPGEVRVRVEISGVNPTDWKARRGDAAGRRTSFPEIVPNQDGAGVIDAIAEDVYGVATGDRVWMFLAAHERPTGTAQQFVVLPAERVIRLPEGASFEVGASLGVPAMTAHLALTSSPDSSQHLGRDSLLGRTVLVAGGAGAVGHAAVQLARWAGAQVIATVSTDLKAALASAAGAHHTVLYPDDDAASTIRSIAPDGVDIVVEVSPARNAILNSKVIANHATIAAYATDGGETVTIPIQEHCRLNAKYSFILLYTAGAASLRVAADDITSALRDGALPVGSTAGLPLTRFSLDETASAHDAVEGGVIGKVLIDVGAVE